LAELDITQKTNLDEDEGALIGRAIPASTALLGLTFICCTLLVAGLPPLSGFIGKFAMLSALLIPPDGVGAVATVNWVLLALIIVSSLFALIALSRTGIRFFWTPLGRNPPMLRVIEYTPIVMLIALCVAFTVFAEGVMRYTSATASAIYQPRAYIEAVLSAQPLPTPTNAERLGVPTPQTAQ